MKLSDTAIIPPQVMARQVGEEVVILDLVSGTYFGLDPVGARIWQLVGAKKSLSEICTIMLAEFVVSQQDIERDVLNLINELMAQKLLSLA